MKQNEVITRVKNALAVLKKGGLVIVTDATDREGEGDMVGLAEFVTPQAVNTMITKARGLLCVPMSKAVADRLGLQPMVTNATDAFGTAFTVSTDAKTTSTGISAFDRADTISQLANPHAKATAFYHPGHVFPLIARERGVLERDGHTEAAVDLAKLAGAQPVAYITEIIKKDGTMARRKELKSFAEGVQMPLLSLDDLKKYRYLQNFEVASSITKVKLPTRYGDFTLEAFDTHDGQEPTLLLFQGEIQPHVPLLLRLHSECLTGDLFGSKRCDCGEQLEVALKKIAAVGKGAVLYLRQEGRGIGLANKLKAYHLQQKAGRDTVEANLELGFAPDERNYGIAAAILHQKKVAEVALLTNNPDKIEQLEALGIKVTQRVALEVPAQPENQQYLITKKHKMNHLLKEVD
ncbi:bifunctional 3,4-dihydroxy-2-butanone-4-phosphate synthase/GTP cyclohydrolase II [Liquorilactobacillus satsumensis]|uniref:GTP cyclohydrolase-2 n=1 Tax=Liquorilactobacillus satsumensis DSM 16230 = JCM 12392 TaxID=1423801 RepID=A0A0R1V067_9LACO|nr:bifunctional 3,4-dihydroxy-2-butanone-4-phosphate synthase/GTP cyclohydrolase II [Liquorilactobacillus satsumensis]KRL98870.1 GTP cyclohydrolase II [Liquorilactobacillus satsumensis DSM 16230 = JCM 12392]